MTPPPDSTGGRQVEVSDDIPHIKIEDDVSPLEQAIINLAEMSGLTTDECSVYINDCHSGDF